ncbi:NUDIX domain-containing protein [bacterium]|nr:NUDIX domain-containing protein [bacterium]
MALEKSVLVVTAALIRKENKILIAQRKPDDSLGGLWELPGGKLEPGEREEECIRREIREELDFGITVLQKLGIFQKEFSKRIFELHVFECRYAGGQPKAIECADWRWVNIVELPDFEYSEFEWFIIKTVLNLPPDLKLNT